MGTTERIGMPLNDSRRQHRVECGVVEACNVRMQCGSPPLRPDDEAE